LPLLPAPASDRAKLSPDAAAPGDSVTVTDWPDAAPGYSSAISAPVVGL